jgi:hypothetical protein
VLAGSVLNVSVNAASDCAVTMLVSSQPLSAVPTSQRLRREETETYRNEPL